jgi:hypothetical protein
MSSILRSISLCSWTSNSIPRVWFPVSSRAFIRSPFSGCFSSCLNMKSFIGAVALMVGILAPSVVVAAPPVTPAQGGLLRRLEERHDTANGIHRRAPTCNTASNRACWTTGFDINTDYEVNTPTTGVTRPVNLPYLPSSDFMDRTLISDSTRSRSPKWTTGQAQMALSRPRSCWSTVRRSLRIMPSFVKVTDAVLL